MLTVDITLLHFHFTINYVSRCRGGGEFSVQWLARKWITFFYSIILQYLPKYKTTLLIRQPLKNLQLSGKCLHRTCLPSGTITRWPSSFSWKIWEKFSYIQIQYLLIYVLHLSVYLISSLSHTDIIFHLTALKCTPCAVLLLVLNTNMQCSTFRPPAACTNQALWTYLNKNLHGTYLYCCTANFEDSLSIAYQQMH
jgi:hypothetical protein